MSELVHFLIRDPNQPKTVVYASDLRTKHYGGFGGFFLMGEDVGNVRDSYVFPAIQAGRVLAIQLQLVDKTKRVLRAAVPNVGVFTFRSYPFRHPPAYGGKSTLIAGKFALQQLKPTQPDELDAAVRARDFYFVGYSPQINMATLVG